MEDIMKIVKPPEEFGLLIKAVSETVENEAKEQKDGFLPMLLGTLAASLLGSALTGGGLIKTGKKQLKQIRIFNATSYFN